MVPSRSEWEKGLYGRHTSEWMTREARKGGCMMTKREGQNPKNEEKGVRKLGLRGETEGRVVGG